MYMSMGILQILKKCKYFNGNCSKNFISNDGRKLLKLFDKENIFIFKLNQ